MSYLQETRRREFCGGCEAGVPHDCKRGKPLTDDPRETETVMDGKGPRSW